MATRFCFLICPNSKVPGVSLGTRHQEHLEPYILGYKAPTTHCLFGKLPSTPPTRPHPQLLVEHLQFAGARRWVHVFKIEAKP